MDGRIVSVALVWFPRLLEATPAQRKRWEAIGGGRVGLHGKRSTRIFRSPACCSPSDSCASPDAVVQPRTADVQSGRSDLDRADVEREAKAD